MLGRLCGVCAPVPHGVLSSSLAPSTAPEYMPSNVEEVKLRIDRVRLGGGFWSVCWFSKRSGFWASAAGEEGREESVDAGVRSKVRRGIGW